jgi:hypothetical protein
MRTLLLLPLLAALLVSATPAAAEDGPSEAELVRRGVAEREKGHDEAALGLFRQAFERFRTPRAQAQMGLACQALGRWGEADQHLRAALGSTSDSWIANNRGALEQALKVIETHVGTLEVTSNVPGTEVLVDGRLIGELPLRAPIRVAAGTAMVQVRALGHASVQRPVTILAGQLTREMFNLYPGSMTTPAAAAPAAPAAPTAAPPPAYVEATPVTEPTATFLQSKTTFIVAAAATVVAAGVTVWSGLDTLAKRDDYQKDPTKAAYDDGVKRELRTNLLIGGTALLGTATLGLGLFATRW